MEYVIVILLSLMTFMVYTKLTSSKDVSSVGELIFFEDTDEIYIQFDDATVRNLKPFLIENVNQPVELTIKLVRTKKTDSIMKK